MLFDHFSHTSNKSYLTPTGFIRILLCFIIPQKVSKGMYM